ncbi:MAG: alpha/beta hydrolase [Myxococcota bacterium]
MRTWLGLALVGCSGAETEPVVPPVDYAEAGPWAVGTEQRTFPGPEGLELTAQVWYPSDGVQGAGTRYDGLLEGRATEGMAVACDAPRPVVVFSHGLGGVRWQSPFFVEHLASHGFVVVAVDHPGSGLFDTDYDALPAVTVRRPADMAAAFDGLAAAYPDCVDPSAGYAAAGHSYGGYTAFAAAGAVVNDPTAPGTQIDLGDPRVWAVVAMAPWDGASITDGTSAVDVPVLVLTGREDETTVLRQVRDLWQPLAVTPRVFGIIDTAGHYSFSPVACLLETGDGCGPGFMDEPTFTRLVRRSSAAFLAGRAGMAGTEDQEALEDPLVTWTVER